MEREGAASSAPDEGPEQLVHAALSPLDLTGHIAIVEPEVEQPVVDSAVPVEGTVKEEEVDFNPDITEEADIVGDFLGVEVETCACSGSKKSLVNPLHLRCLTTCRVPPKAHHWK